MVLYQPIPKTIKYFRQKGIILSLSISKQILFTNFGSELSFPIAAGATFLIDESYKIIQIPTTFIVFTSFIAPWEKFEGGIATYTIPASESSPN